MLSLLCLSIAISYAQKKIVKFKLAIGSGSKDDIKNGPNRFGNIEGNKNNVNSEPTLSPIHLLQLENVE